MDAQSIFNSIRGALLAELSDGYSTISGFVEDQGRLLSAQAAFIAEQRAAGELRNNDVLYNHFMDGLKNNTENMARSVAMLTALTIEKAWNAIANALWGGIRTILSGAGLPANLIPDTPPHI